MPSGAIKHALLALVLLSIPGCHLRATCEGYGYTRALSSVDDTSPTLVTWSRRGYAQGSRVHFTEGSASKETRDGDLVLGDPWNVQKPGVEVIEGVGEVVLHAGDSVVAHPGEFHAVGRGAVLGQLSCLVTASRYSHARNFILFPMSWEIETLVYFGG